MNIFVMSLVFVCMVLNTAAQLLLKTAMTTIGHFDFAWINFFPITFKIAFNPFFLGGLGCYVLSMLMWLMVLSRTDVSLAYPLTSIGFILTPLCAYFLLGESLTLPRIMGILVIVVGVYLVTRS